MVETASAAVGLARPEVLDAHVLQPLGVRGKLLGVVPHADRRAQLHRSGSSRGGLAAPTIEDTIYPCRSPSPKTTAPWDRRPRTSWPNAMPEGPPGLCSRPRPRDCPAFWDDLASLGWLGLHLPEERGGSGFGLPELVVVVEELGRAVAPGPFVPTVIASAVIDAAAPDELAARLLPGLADGSVLGGIGLDVRHHRVRGYGRRDGAGGPGRWPRPRARPPGGRRRHRRRDVGRRRDGRGARQPRPDPAQRPRHARRCAARGHPRGRAGARRPGPPRHRRRGDRHRHRVHRTGGRLRQGARAVRPADRHVPGGQAPLRQHARGLRARHRPGVGRRPRRRGGRRPAGLRRRHGGLARACRPPTSTRSSTSRCTAASGSPGSTTPTCISAGPPRSRP